MNTEKTREEIKAEDEKAKSAGRALAAYRRAEDGPARSRARGRPSCNARSR